ncbi:outer membrane porin GjpA [Mycolicibacterium vaccae]|uniref:outer membrane porin GjpA n=1 Tax=Mycolicibacterium vaccae TaxID=1810 RepID=UPI003CE72A31
MYTALRPYATAGVAMLGASAMAIAPVVVTPALPDLKLAAPAVQLSAAIDPLTPVLDLFNKSEVNVANLVGSWLEAPAPVLQQIIANQIRYLGELPDIGVILNQMGANVMAGLAAPFAEDLSSMGDMHAAVYDMIVNGIPGAIEPAPPHLVPVLKFTTTYLSGMLVGLAGLVMNPVLALGSSIHSVFQNLGGEDADIKAALNTLINIPTAMVDAFLNGGQTMNVTPLLTMLGMNLPVPGMEVDLAFGGLLSAGGSMFNSLNLVFNRETGDVVAGSGAGFIGSLIGLTKAIAKAIGWDGQGNPLAPPLNAPEPALRDAADASVVAASRTVTLDTTDGLATETPAAGESAADSEGPEGDAAPAVSETEPTEGDVQEPVSEDVPDATEDESGTGDDASEPAVDEDVDTEPEVEPEPEVEAPAEDEPKADADDGSAADSGAKAGAGKSSSSRSSGAERRGGSRG